MIFISCWKTPIWIQIKSVSPGMKVRPSIKGGGSKERGHKVQAVLVRVGEFDVRCAVVVVSCNDFLMLKLM